MSQSTRKKIANAVIEKLSSEVLFRDRGLTIEEITQEQAHNVRKHLYGDIQYRPFLERW